LLIVFGNAFTLGVQPTESELRRRIVLISSFAVLLHGCREFIGFLICPPELVS
jgi:hypothetical protein